MREVSKPGESPFGCFIGLKKGTYEYKLEFNSYVRKWRKAREFNSWNYKMQSKENSRLAHAKLIMFPEKVKQCKDKFLD
jgi:hypothetical protein